MCETIGNKTIGRKFDSQTRHVADSQNCKGNRDPQAKPDVDSMSEDKSNLSDYLNSTRSKTNMPDYFNSSNNKEEARRVRQSQTEYAMNLMTFFLV